MNQEIKKVYAIHRESEKIAEAVLSEMTNSDKYYSRSDRNNAYSIMLLNGEITGMACKCYGTPKNESISSELKFLNIKIDDMRTVVSMSVFSEYLKDGDNARRVVLGSERES